MSTRHRILTGDTPTGNLHIGHWVGSVKRRVELQSEHECYFLIANLHAYTTRADKPHDVHRDCIEVARDALAMGVDPEKAAIFLQSEVPALSELTYLFAMLLPFNRVMRNPTLKDELQVKGLADNYSFGFPLYTVGQTADILAFRAHSVPVGEDQVPHLELTREVARRFNKMYCGVADKAPDEEHEQLGGIFPIPVADVGKVGRLVGTDGQNKMSKSLGNTIHVIDTPKQVKKKIGKIYTGQDSRQPTDPGIIDPEKNPLFQYLDVFVNDEDMKSDIRDRYERGDNIGDGEVKMLVADAINELLEPMRERRKAYEDDAVVLNVLRAGTAKAVEATETTLAMAKNASGTGFFPRTVSFC
ncbi:MAG: tryptophan--tRNA ligase [Planctomycetes bacterium]|jgi:tryptophanyl-tRNA synthetase|nr:tryptophan--tRNA ligase [Planctomycetota bacterium]MCP4839224.1 tryptophan--tRNA ligase [Planctomycetota bacterium]